MRSSIASTSGRPRRSSRPSRSTSSSSTSSRRAGACGPCAGASVLRATASSTTRSPRRSSTLRRDGRTDAELDAALRELSISLVLTAHPTEARRRTTLLALHRCAVLLERLDDPRLTPSDDREVRRRLREEITVLWRTSDLRAVAPTPLDEVRTAMAFFDATIFTLVPDLYRGSTAPSTPPLARRRAAGPTDAGRTGTRPPRVQPFLHWGSWIGGDRDGNPGVTADVTERTLRIHADHVLHGYEAVATRLMQTVSAAVGPGPGLAPARPPARPRRRPASRDRPPAAPAVPRGAVPPAVRVHRRATASHPGGADRRGRRPSRAATPTPAELDAELAELQDALLADGLERVAWGDVADFRWQVATFGFHLASLEIRQHAAVHRAALEALRSGRPRHHGGGRRASPSTRSSRRSGRSASRRRGTGPMPATGWS